MATASENIKGGLARERECLHLEPSVQLVRTNPRLTTNVKVVMDSSGNVYLETFDGIEDLSGEKFKGYTTSSNSSYRKDLAEFYDRGGATNDAIFRVKENGDFLAIQSEYNQQYDTTYHSGARPKSSQLYNEQLSFLAPLWGEPNCLPEYFVVFRVDDPVSLSSKDLQNENDPSFINNIEDPGKIPENILSKAKVLKTFDLTGGSNQGSYIRQHFLDPNFPEAPVFFDNRVDSFVRWNGISLNDMTFTSEGVVVDDSVLRSDRTVREFENFVTNGFMRNHMACPNLLNLEFLFDDPEADEFSMHRYFGLYVTEVELAKFQLDPELFYERSDKEPEQRPRPVEVGEVGSNDIEFDQFVENPNGVKIYCDEVEGDIVKTAQQKDLPRFGYVKGKDGFYLLDNNGFWNDGDELRVSNKKVNLRDLSGFNEPLESKPAELGSSLGRPHALLEVVERPFSGDEFRVEFVDISESGLSKVSNFTLKANSGVEEGKSDGRFFSNQGSLRKVAIALSSAIENLKELNRGVVTSSQTVGSKVLIFSRIDGSFYNRIKIWAYTSNSTHFLKHIEGPDPIDVTQSSPYFEAPNGATVSFGTILKTSLKGGSDEAEKRLVVEPDLARKLTEEDTQIVTEDGTRARVETVSEYLSEPSFDKTGMIESFATVGKKKVVELENDQKPLVENGRITLYRLFRPSCGFMSMVPVKDLDFDTYTSDYGDSSDSDPLELYDELLSLYPVSYPFPDFGNSLLQSAIENMIGPDSEFVEDGGYFSLAGLEQDDGTIPTIDNEYDRLNENTLKELAIRSRVVPFINKWGSAKDVRENPYRLNISDAFRFTNFSPSELHFERNSKFYTHEWPYIATKPPRYLSTKAQLEETYSYFNEEIDRDKILGLTSNDGYFDEYFTVTSLNGENIDVQKRYSKFEGGDNTSYPLTFFRGVKLLLKKKADRSPVNFNINNLDFVQSNQFNGYKFSCVYAIGEAGMNITVVRDDRNRTVTLLVELEADDPNFVRRPNGDRILDRSLLYTMKDKIREDPSLLNYYEDVPMSGAVELFHSEWYMNGLYKVRGQRNIINGTDPNFVAETQVNRNGNYNTIYVETTFGTFTFKGIVDVGKNFFTCEEAYLDGNLLPQASANGQTPFGYPSNSFLAEFNPTYTDGGRNFYDRIFTKASFANIAEMLNSGNPAVEYVSILSDGSRVTDDFVLEVIHPELFSKRTFLSSIEDTDRPSRLTTSTNIGSKVKKRPSVTSSLLKRHNYYFKPIMKDVFKYLDTNDMHQDKIAGANVQFDIWRSDFGFIENMFINKVNPNNQKILELSKQGTYLPLYPAIGEISIDRSDHYVFRSNWDPHYYLYEGKEDRKRVLGTRDPVNEPSFFGSKIMKLPERLRVETFSGIQLDFGPIGGLANVNNIAFSPFSDYRFEVNGRSVRYTVNVGQALIKKLKDLGISRVFERFVNPEFSFGDKSTLSDDVDRYIRENILERFEVTSVEFYKKPVPEETPPDNITESYIEQVTRFSLDDSEKLSQGFEQADNVQINRGFEDDLVVEVVNTIGTGTKNLYALSVEVSLR